MKRTMFALIFAAAALALAAPSTAIAQPTASELAKKRNLKLKKYDFTGDDVEGVTVNPDGVNVNVRKFATFENLIEVRNSFADKILRDTEDI